MSQKTKQPHACLVPPTTQFAAFDELAKKLMGVPKAVVDAREAEYQRSRKANRVAKPQDKSK